MQKAKALFFSRRQLAPIGAHLFQQVEGSQHIGLDKRIGPVDGAVNMRLGRKVDDGAWLVRGQQLAQQRTVAYIALHKLVQGLVGQAFQAF